MTLDALGSAPGVQGFTVRLDLPARGPCRWLSAGCRCKGQLRLQTHVEEQVTCLVGRWGMLFVPWFQNIQATRWGGISSPGRPEQEPLQDRAGEERGAPEHLGHAGLGAGGRCRKVSWGPWGAVDPIPMSLHPVGFSEGTF